MNNPIPYFKHAQKLRTLFVLAATAIAKVCEEGPGEIEAFPRLFRLYALVDLGTPSDVLRACANVHAYALTLSDQIERQPGSPTPVMQHRLAAAGSAIADVLGELCALADDLTVNDPGFALMVVEHTKPPATIFDFSGSSDLYELHGVKTHGFGQPAPFRDFPEGATGLYLVTVKISDELPAPRIGDKLIFRHRDDTTTPAILCTVVHATPSPNWSSKAWILCARVDGCAP